MVLHPACLEGRVLTAVGEDDELLVILRGGVDHRLGQDVNVGHGDRLDLPGRFDGPAADLVRRRAARGASGQAGAENDEWQERLLVTAAIGQAARRRLAVHRPALAAEPRPGPAGGPCGRPPVRFLQQAVGQDESCTRALR